MEPASPAARSRGRLSISQLALLCLLALVAAIAALPGYFQGNWSWSDVPLVMNIHHLKTSRNPGLNLPGWSTVERTEIQIGEHFWGVQTVEGGGESPITLFFMPQEYYRMQPQVEWTDLQGTERWKTDSHQTLTFSLPGKAGGEVKANFFRAWRQQTFAVVQWYAWYHGGNPDPAHWFWADQQAQLRRQRVPWIAVCLKIPIDPLSDLDSHRPFAKSLAQTVQTALDREIFSK
jgi:cyanoexosortase B-associated protein